MPRSEDPDRASERFEQAEAERALAEARRDRIADYTPAPVMTAKYDTAPKQAK